MGSAPDATRRQPALVHHRPDSDPAICARSALSRHDRLRLAHTQAEFGDLLNHLKSTRESESGILMGVHPAGFLVDWVFGDFQSPRLSPDEPSIQPIEASQLARLKLSAPDPI